MKRNLLWLLPVIGIIIYFAFFKHDASDPYGFSLPWYYNRWAQHSLAALFGALIGAFLSDKFRPIRRFLFWALLLIGTAIAVIADVNTGNIVIFLVSAVIIWLKFKDAKAAKAKKEKNTTFGSAEWANFEHLQKNKLIGKDGLFLGSYRDQEITHPLHYTGNRHLLTVAPTRSGKGVSSIIPNLLTYEGSAIIIDPKGENARITAIRRSNGDENLKIKGLGQTVHIVDPWGITGFNTSCFNPLAWLVADDADICENAMILADAIITPRQGNADPFWDDEAKALLMGILLYVAIDEVEDNRHLGYVRDIIISSESVFKEVLQRMGESNNSIVRTTAERSAGKDPKLLSNILASLQSHTHFLDSPRIRANLSKSDFQFESLKTEKMTIYLVLPADRLDTFGRWLRILIQQAITVNARNIEQKPDKPILFMLDEMVALGKLKMLEQAYSLMAGFGMQLWGIVQDLSQLEQIYGKGWETFIGNSGVLQYFGSRDHKTAEYFSKLCGVTTVEKFSFSNTIAKAFSSFYSSTISAQGGSSNSGGGTSTTYSDSITTDVVQRQLAYPDELMVMREGKQIVLIESFNPIRSHRLRWFEDSILQEYGIHQQN